MSDGFESGEESSAYSYKDFAIYQYSDDESSRQGRPDNNNHKASTVSLEDLEDLEDEDASFNNWNDYGSESSYVMHVQSDDEFERYNFSEEDLIPEEPDEEWIVAALMGNRRDFDHLELLEEMDDFTRFIQAIEINRVVKSVTVYETFFDGIPTVEEKRILAETICNMRQLEHLKVYFHSSYFVTPLDKIRPPNLKHLCLMFFPEQPDKASLVSLTRLLKGDHIENNDQEADEGEEAETTSIAGTETLASLPLESLSLRCDIMDDEFIEAIASGISVNPTMTALSFWGNTVRVTPKGAANSSKIDFFLRLNQRGIRDMHLLVNATPVEFLDKVVNERESIDLLFYLLQTNPSFLSYSTV